MILNSVNLDPWCVAKEKSPYFYQVEQRHHRCSGVFRGRRHSEASGSLRAGSPSNNISPYGFSVRERDQHVKAHIKEMA